MMDDSVAEGQHLQKEAIVGDKTEQDRSPGERGMYSSITIDNFRLFRHLELDDLARVNLFFGPNNSGKTSILEAIFTHACGRNFGPFLGQVVTKRRGGPPTGALDLGEQLITLFRDRSSLPYTFAISAKLVEDASVYTVKSIFRPSSELADLDPRALGQFSENISSSSSSSSSATGGISPGDQVSGTNFSSIHLGGWQTWLNDKQNVLEIRFPASAMPLLSRTPFKLGTLHDILDHRHPSSEMRVLSYLTRYGILDEFLQEMAKAFPGVREIYVGFYPGGQGPVSVEMEDRRLPLYVFGDGMRRWFYLLGHMLVFTNAIHCIEEIDFGFHPDARRDLSRLLIEYAEKYGNQLFLTSHSMEFADAFLEALYGEEGVLVSSSEDPVRIFTIRPSVDDKGMDVWKFTGREAYKNRSLYNLELR